MALARNVCDPDLAEDFRRTALAEVLISLARKMTDGGIVSPSGNSLFTRK
jgi:hypothetical protein